MPKLDSRELATVLHALRALQCEGRIEGCAAGDCEHFDDAEVLTNDEIDDLCERVNQVPEPEPALELLGRLMDFIEADVLVRNTRLDGRGDWAMRQIPFVMTLTAAQKLVDGYRSLATAPVPSAGE